MTPGSRAHPSPASPPGGRGAGASPGRGRKADDGQPGDDRASRVSEPSGALGRGEAVDLAEEGTELADVRAVTEDLLGRVAQTEPRLVL